MPAGPVSRSPPFAPPSAAPGFRRQRACPWFPPQEHAMKVLACDGIHEDGLALFRQAGWIVEISDPIKDPSALSKALEGADALLVRSATAVGAPAIGQADTLRV